MVHRPARALRCQNCIRRKVKCDGGKPHCQRCLRTSLKCEGYETGRIFIDEGARFRKEEIPGVSQTALERKGPQNRSAGSLPRKPSSGQLQVHNRIRTLPLQEDVVFLAYFLSRFPDSTAATHSGPLGVLPKALAMGAYHPQQSAVRALVTVYFGKTRYDRRVYDRGMRLYSNAIVNLCETLSVPGRAAERDTLVGALCLCLFENVVLSGPVAWLRHYKGVSDLLKSGGPISSQNELERDIFRYCRFIAILSDGHLRQHCFLSDQAWKSPHWALDGSPPNPVDLLHDIFADVPGVLHDFDKLHSTDIASASDDYHSLCQRVQSTLLRLHEWTRCLSQHQHQNRPEPVAVYDTGFPQRAADAVALATCYAIMLCLMAPCESLKLPLFPEGAPYSIADPGFPSNKDNARSGKALAVEICHLATSAFRGKLSLPIGFSLIFPLQIASCYITSATPEANRLEGIMDCIVAESHGIEIGRRRAWGDIAPEQGAAELTGTNFLKSSQDS